MHLSTIPLKHPSQPCLSSISHFSFDPLSSLPFLLLPRSCSLFSSFSHHLMLVETVRCGAASSLPTHLATALLSSLLFSSLLCVIPGLLLALLFFFSLLVFSPPLAASLAHVVAKPLEPQETHAAMNERARRERHKTSGTGETKKKKK